MKAKRSALARVPSISTLIPTGDTHTVELTESLGGVSFAYLTSATGERMVVEERGDERTPRGPRSGSVLIRAVSFFLTQKQNCVSEAEGGGGFAPGPLGLPQDIFGPIITGQRLP